MSKVRRKPPPAFPYSPRYPHPDPADPFVPLNVLRERAQSSNPDDHSESSAFLPPDNSPFFLTPAPDSLAPLHEQRRWQDPSFGYQSDSPRPQRPPRSRVRPARDSKSYSSDVDLPSASLHRHHELIHHRKEKPADQYHYRRRSQSVFILPQTPHADRPSPPTDAPPSNAGATPHLSADADVEPAAAIQYTYDERQSHGYVFGQEEVDIEIPPPAHHDSTPPMTPDDTMSLSSSSARDRSVSLSPGPLLRELPRSSSRPALTRESTTVESKADHGHPAAGRPAIQSADFPILLVPSRTPSPATAAPPPAQTGLEPVRVPPVRRGRTESLTKRSSVHTRLRKISASKGSRASLHVHQRQLSNASLRRIARKSSTASDSSIMPGPHARQTLHAATASGVESDPGEGAKPMKFLSLAPKKSLSHVSLGVTALPNISMGTTMVPSANTSMASAITVSATPGTVPAREAEVPGFSQLQSRFPIRESMVLASDSQAIPHSHPHPRRSTIPVAAPDESVDSIAELIAELEPQVRVEEVDGEEEDQEAYTALTTFTRPLSPVRSSSPERHPTGSRNSHFPLLQRNRTPSPPQRVRALPIPPARVKSPDPEPSPLVHSPLPPPRSQSPTRFYVSPAPSSEEPPRPAPLPISPPHHDHSECPTPLPLPPPPRAASPPPSLPAQPRENALPTRPRSPPHEARPRRKEASREDDRQSTYLPVAQLRPQSQAQMDSEVYGPPRAQPQAVGRSRTAAAPSVPADAPMRRSTVVPTLTEPPPPRPLSPVLQAPQRRQSPPADQQTRAQSPSAHLSYRPQAPPVPPQFRAQSPPPAQQHHAHRQQSAPVPSLHRSQSPPLPQPPPRARAPHASAYARAQSPPPPPVTAPAYTHPAAAQQARGGGSSQGHGAFSQLSRSGTSGTGMSSAPQSTPAPQPRRPGTAPATPVPQYTMPASPSPSFSVQSHPGPAPSSRPRPHSRMAPPPHPRAPFDEHAAPPAHQLAVAASLFVVAQNGLRVQFGELFRERRTIVIFIRHFWCPLCQDYMHSVARGVDFDELRRAGVSLVFIGNGSPGMIKSYRQIFHSPFEMYTDPSLRLHAALGMTRRSTDPGPEVQKGAYVRHGLIGGIAMVVRNALRVAMPVWEKGGDIAQLGGEFVLGPGLNCTYAHRMRNTRAHAPILHVLSAAGVRRIPFAPEPAARAGLYPADEDAWMEDRRRSLARIHTRREKRREGTRAAPVCDEECAAPYESDAGSGSVSGCWGSGAREPAPQADDERAAEKRARRFHVANPDPGLYGAHVWEGGVPDLAFSQNYARTAHDEQYRLAQEMVSYSFGKS